MDAPKPATLPAHATTPQRTKKRKQPETPPEFSQSSIELQSSSPETSHRTHKATPSTRKRPSIVPIKKKHFQKSKEATKLVARDREFELQNKQSRKRRKSKDLRKAPTRKSLKK